MNIKILLLLALPVALLSCIKQSPDQCKVELEFIFNYNMEYTDSFDPHVGTIDVYVFDGDGKYLFHKYAERESLIGGKRMALDRKLISGKCSIIALGGFTEYFQFTDVYNNKCQPGITTIEEIKLALIREGTEVSHEFPHLWFGEASFDYRSESEIVWPVYLVRDTNKFHIGILTNTGSRSEANQPVYSFGITTPEGGAYGYDNNPLDSETIVYQPFLLSRGEQNDPEILSEGKINTMRLLAEHPGYKLIVRDPSSLKELWNYDLIQLLEKTKPRYRPDGTDLPLQEYLDRQGDWNIVILTREAPSEENGFTAIAIEVNGWIFWMNEIEI